MGRSRIRILTFLSVFALAFFFCGALGAADKDNNPPGKKGGPGTNWENPPGPKGGPGASPDKRGVPPPDKRPPKDEFCAKHPNDPKCTGVKPPKPYVGLPPQAAPAGPPPGHSKFCQKHPWHKKCKPGYHHGNPPGPAGGPGAGYNPPGPAGGPGAGYNPPGPAGGPGAGYNPPGPAGGPGKGPHDLDNNPPGKKGGPGTNWENPPGRKGGPGASPNRKAPPPKGKKR